MRGDGGGAGWGGIEKLRVYRLRSIAIAYAKNPKIRNFAFGDLSQLRACFPAKLGDLEIPCIRVGLI